VRANNVVSYLLGDHLGSTSITMNTSGVKTGELRYKAFGETRYTSGTTPTKRQYTGQINEAEIGLYFYNARFYDPALGRFTSADTLIPQPGNPLAWDRYAYTLNNPLRYIDPSGHSIFDTIRQLI
jgi:RHS repeat-associated protein